MNKSHEQQFVISPIRSVTSNPNCSEAFGTSAEVTLSLCLIQDVTVLI